MFDKGSKIRLIAHSLGARVVLSAIENLYNNQQWNEKHFNITSVHLLGAAVDDEEIAKDPLYIIKNPPLTYSDIKNPNKTQSVLEKLNESYDLYGIKSAYGKTIEKTVDKFYNLYNNNDKLLMMLYPSVNLTIL